jgi:hypothetical protein
MSCGMSNRDSIGESPYSASLAHSSFFFSPRYLHFFSRYHSHDQSLKHAIKLRNSLLQGGAKDYDILERDSLLKAANLVPSDRLLL